MYASRNGLKQASFSQSHMSSGVLPALKVLEIINTGEKPVIETLFELHDNLALELCYCSKYQDCWLTDSRNRPEPIENCSIIPTDKFIQ